MGLDYTEIGENELLRATRKMPSLESLSIENLNGGRILYEEDSLNSSRKKYGLITSRLFDRLKYKTLRYINICIFLPTKTTAALLLIINGKSSVISNA